MPSFSKRSPQHLRAAQSRAAWRLGSCCQRSAAVPAPRRGRLSSSRTSLSLKPGPSSGGRARARRRAGAALKQRPAHVLLGEHPFVTPHGGAHQSILELPHITRPPVVQEHVARTGREGLGLVARFFCLAFAVRLVEQGIDQPSRFWGSGVPVFVSGRVGCGFSPTPGRAR